MLIYFKDLKMKALVSIFIPTYNREVLLERAINSVINQTYTNIELIIVDDCSTDCTEAVVKFYQNTDTRIKYIRNSENLGACASRNKAIRAAQGEFITGLDDDDYFLPDRLAVFVKHWGLFPADKAFIFANKIILNSESECTSRAPWYIRRRKSITQGDLLIGCAVGIAFFTTRESLSAIAGFDELIPMWQDLDCVYRLLELGKGYYFDDVSYVVDASHDYGRISDANTSKLIKVHEYFCQKHDLKGVVASNLMKMHFISYGENHIKFVPSLLGAIHRPSITNMKYLLKSLGRK